MEGSRLIKISKYLSKYLRHTPEQIGIKLAPGGWVEVDELLDACKKHSFPIERFELNEMVAKNEKKRFSFNSTGTHIRANQGHSIEVDLQLDPTIPPNTLYHGTGHNAVESICREGIHRMSRHHVHLTSDIKRAKQVGMRHGRPIVFAVNAKAMYEDGYRFYCSENGVWLVDYIPPKYLQPL